MRTHMQYLNTCTHADIHTHINTHMYTHITNAHTHKNISVHKHAGIYIRTHTLTFSNIGPYTHIYTHIGGARGVMVIVVGNGHGDTSSNPGQE